MTVGRSAPVTPGEVELVLGAPRAQVLRIEAVLRPLALAGAVAIVNCELFSGASVGLAAAALADKRRFDELLPGMLLFA